MCISLSLNAAGSVALCQGLNFVNSDQVEVVANGVLQAGSSNSKVNGALGVLANQLAVNQAAAEAIAAADAIDDMQMIALGEAVVLAVIEHCRPAIIEYRVALMQGDGNLLKACNSQRKEYERLSYSACSGKNYHSRNCNLHGRS